MHSAPSVSYPVGRSRFAAAFLLLAWLSGAGAILAWWVQVQPAAPRLALAALLLVATALLAAWNWRNAACGELAWDGQDWHWASATGTLSVALDLQGCLLLRWQQQEGNGWLWLERAACAERWEDLRRAVYSRASPHALSGAQPPAAKT